MISDWTIYGVTVIYPDTGDYEGTYCVSCFKDHCGQGVADTVHQGLVSTAHMTGDIDRLAEWLDENSLHSVAVLRSLWGRWGLPMWLSDLVDEAFPHSFPAEPRISVELDWEQDCYQCEATGKVVANNTIDYEQADEDNLIDCPDCDGIGVTGPRCDNCDEIL